MTNNVYALFFLAIISIIVIFGLLIYGIMKFYDWFKECANNKILVIMDRAIEISDSENKHPINLYAVHGFLNISIECRKVVYLKFDNIHEMEMLAMKLNKLSYRLSIYTFRIHGLFLIWWNYRSIFKKISEFKSG